MNAMSGSFWSRRRARRWGEEPFLVLDVGVDKIACFVVRLDKSVHAPAEILGVGHHLAKGVRQGRIVDITAAEDAIRAAVDAAERMAGFTVRDVILAVGGGALASRTVGVDMMVEGQGVTDEDVRQVISHGARACAPDGAELLHALPIAFDVDGVKGVKDPRGLFGDMFSIVMHGVSAAPAALQSLVACVERCHLRVVDLAAGPYAAGLSCLVEDERDLGAILIDMGAGSTSLAVFEDGVLVHCDAAPVGGGHITSDIAKGLSTTMSHAERLKTLYGSALASAGDEHRLIDITPIDADAGGEAHRAPRSQLTEIICARLEETFELVADRLAAAGARAAGKRIVLTGGASQMNGAREAAEKGLRRPVRLGGPMHAPSLAEVAYGPAYAVCAGLVQYAANAKAADEDDAMADYARFSARGAHGAGPVAKVGGWFRDRF